MDRRDIGTLSKVEEVIYIALIQTSIEYWKEKLCTRKISRRRLIRRNCSELFDIITCMR